MSSPRIMLFAGDLQEAEVLNSLLGKLEPDFDVEIQSWALLYEQARPEADVLLLFQSIEKIQEEYDVLKDRLYILSEEKPIVLITPVLSSYLADSWPLLGIQDYLPLSQLTAELLRKSIKGSIGRLHNQIERKKTEVVSLSGKRSYEGLFFETVDLHAILNFNGRFLVLNKNWQIDLEERELTGEYIWDFLDPNDADQMRSAWERIKISAEPAYLITDWKGNDNKRRTVEWKITSFEKYLLMATARDITGHQKKARELELLGERYQLVKSVAKQGVWDWDMKSNRIAWDSELFEICGVDEENFEGTFQAWERIVHPDDIQDQINFFSQAATEGKILDSSFRIFRHGEIRHIRSRGRIVLDNARKPERLLGVIWDVTEEVASTRSLAESYSQLESMLNNVGEVVFQCTRNGKWIFLSSAWREITGLDPKQCVGLQIAEFLYPEDMSLNQEMLKTLVDRKGDNLRYEIRVLHGDDYRWVSVYARGVVTGGELTSIVGTMQDISTQKKAEQALHKSEDRFRAIFQSSLHFIGLLEPDGTVIEANAIALNFAGIDSLEAIVGEFFWNTLCWMRSEKAREELKVAVQQAAKGKAIRYNVEVIGKDRDQVITIDFSITPLLDHNGQVYLLILEGRDITERITAQRKFATSESMLRELTENVDEVFWTHSRKPFRLLYVNSAYTKLMVDFPNFQYEKPLSILEDVSETHTKLVKDSLARYADGEVIDEEFLLTPKDREKRWVHVHTFNSMNEVGKVVRQMGIITDITKRKEKELSLLRALEQEKELNRQKSQFVATASHQFRTSLTSIQTSIEIVKILTARLNQDHQGPLVKYLMMIENEIMKFRDLMTDILTIEGLENGKVPFKPAYNDLCALCEEIIRAHFSVQSKEREVTFEYAGNAGLVVFDKKLMGHIVINLVSNALKFSDSSVDLKLEFKENETVVRVKDRGIGIEAAEIPRLFESFYRATNSSDIQGTGLGLTIVKQFVDLHEGSIDVRSILGEGTEIRVTIPHVQEVKPTMLM